MYLAGTRLLEPTEDGDEFVFVVTDSAPRAALGLYLFRWSIENLFQREQPVRCYFVSKTALKSRGFNFEATRVCCPVRLSNLLSLLTLGLFWCYLVGAFQVERGEQKRLKHGRFEMGVFRLGLDALERLLCSGRVNGLYWRKAITFLEFGCDGFTLFNTS